jgi:hypothetical protein
MTRELTGCLKEPKADVAGAGAGVTRMSAFLPCLLKMGPRKRVLSISCAGVADNEVKERDEDNVMRDKIALLLKVLAVPEYCDNSSLLTPLLQDEISLSKSPRRDSILENHPIIRSALPAATQSNQR